MMNTTISDVNGPAWSDLRPKSSRTDEKLKSNRTGPLKVKVEPNRTDKNFKSDRTGPYRLETTSRTDAS